MTELQLPKPPHHPVLRRAAYITLAAAVAGISITLAISGASAIGWIADVPWLSRARAAVRVCAIAGGVLLYLSGIRPDSLTRRMQRTGAVALPPIMLAMEPFTPANAVLAGFLAFGIAYTADTQTGFRAWSRERWLAGLGSLGFVLFFAGVAGPEHSLNWVAIVASLPLLVMALDSGMRLYEADKARDEDGARDANPAALTGAAPPRSNRMILDDPT